MELAIIISIVLLVCAIAVKPIRKTVGLLFIILGIVECLSIFLMFIGIPTILVGGLLLFS